MPKAIQPPTTDGYHRAVIALPITLNRPTGTGHEIITGTLLGAMHDRGEVLHYRVSVGDGTVYLAPPSWLHPDSRVDVVRAGLDIPDHMEPGMWVNTINRVAEKWANAREPVA